jgi:hypothetical protein
VLAALEARPVLTVSEIEGFARRGGAIGLVVDGSKVRFEIDPASARKRGVIVGSELLSVGRVVSQEPPRP